MSTLLQHLAAEGGVLLAAATCLLAIGCAGMALHRSPIHRQRAGELAILGVLVWLALACLPLPRYGLPRLWPGASVSPSRSRPVEPTAGVETPLPVFDFLDEAILAEVMVEAEPPLPADPLPPEIGTVADDGEVAAMMVRGLPEQPTAAGPETFPETEVAEAAAHQPVYEEGAMATPGGPSSAAVAPAFDPRHVLSIGYLAGVLGCLVWLAFGRVLLLRMLWSARPAEPWLREVYQRLPFGQRQRPRLLISERCTRALSFGIWRPTIVLPGEACRTDRGEGLRHVLLHELAHARQRDGWGHLLFNVAFPLLYFHPLYWWMRSRTYLAAELIADDWAAAPAAKESYVEALIALAKRGGRLRLAYASSPQILGSRSQFYRRMQMLLDRETRLARRCSPLWRLFYPTACLAAVVLVAGAAGVRPAEAQPEEALPEADELVIEVVEAGEDVPKPPAPIDPDVADGELVADEAVLEVEPEESPEMDELSDTEVSRLKQDRIELRAERARLLVQLEELKASVDILRQMVDQLRARQQLAAQAAPRGIPKPVLPGGPGATPTAPKRPPPAVGTIPEQTAPSPPPSPPAPRFPGPAPAQPMVPSLTEPLEKPRLVDPALKSPSAGRRADPFAAVAERRAPEGTRLDLVRLATSYADSMGELDIARLELEGRKELAERKAVSNHELAIAEIRFKTAQRKVAVLRSIAESAIRATKAEMDAAQSHFVWVKKNRPDDDPALESTRSEIVRAESKLQILQSILD
ncbi:MAG: M56 family metallopeptidase [Planctomycetota bacterium]|jgi:beta-lactamase regulating signal transducer with metallopeptidase domain